MKSVIHFLLLVSMAFGQLDQTGLSYYVETDSDIYSDTSSIHWLSVVKNTSSDTIQTLKISGTVAEWYMVDTTFNIYNAFDFIYYFPDTVDIAPSDSIMYQWSTSANFPTGYYYGLIRPWVYPITWWDDPFIDEHPFAFDSVLFQIIETLNIDESNQLVPNDFKLHHPYPNPFNATLTIRFSVPISGLVNLTSYDIEGIEIEILINQHFKIGTHSITWDGQNQSSGIYFIRMISGNFQETQKVLLVK